MPRKTELTTEIGKANYQRFFAVWMVGSPQIDIFAPTQGGMAKVMKTLQRGMNHPGAIHTLATKNDLNVSGMPEKGLTPDEYVRERLIAWFEEDGEAYMEELDGDYL
jgi:hypothetical protein